MSGRILALVGLAACGGPPAPLEPAPVDPDSDPDSNTDSDSDSDTDSDTDADADTDLLPFEGTVSFQQVELGASLCEKTLALTGVPYTGDCPGCDFAFDLASTETASEGDCLEVPPDMVWTEGDWLVDVRLGFAQSSTVLDASGAPRPVEDAVLIGLSLEGYPGPYWYVLGYAGATVLGETTWDGEALTLDRTLEYAVYPPAPYLGDAGCSPLAGGPVYEQPLVGEQAQALPCVGSALDVWEFSAEAGDQVQLWLDNALPADPEHALSLTLWLTDDTGCSLATGQAFACSAQPASGAALCASLEAVMDTAGTYRVVVGGAQADASGSLSSGSAPYALSGSQNGAALPLTLLADDAPVNQQPHLRQARSELTAVLTSKR
jgi:hypothetical protein